MVVTSLYTRNMLSTTSFPGCYKLVKPGDKLVSLHKVVTSCHKTLNSTAAKPVSFLCYCCCYQVPACDMHVSYMVCASLKNMHATYMFPGKYRHATCTYTRMLYAMCMWHAHSIRVAHSCGYHFPTTITFL